MMQRKSIKVILLMVLCSVGAVEVAGNRDRSRDYRAERQGYLLINPVSIAVVTIAAGTGIYWWNRETNEQVLERAQRALQVFREKINGMDLTNKRPSEEQLRKNLGILGVPLQRATEWESFLSEAYKYVQKVDWILQARYGSYLKPWNWSDEMKQASKDVKEARKLYKEIFDYFTKHDVFSRAIEFWVVERRAVEKLKYEEVDFFVKQIRNENRGRLSFPLCSFVDKVNGKLDYIERFIENDFYESLYPELFSNFEYLQTEYNRTLGDVVNHPEYVKELDLQHKHHIEERMARAEEEKARAARERVEAEKQKAEAEQRKAWAQQQDVWNSQERNRIERERLKLDRERLDRE